MDETELIRQAIDMEEKIVKFYTEAAEQSKALMADVPIAFRLVAKKRRNRLSALRSLLQDP
jgi:rubrerythrin